jgi:hypothetical protein
MQLKSKKINGLKLSQPTAKEQNITTNKEPIKRQIGTENHYHVLRNPQETNEVTKVSEVRKKTRGTEKASGRIQKTKKKNTKPS